MSPGTGGTGRARALWPLARGARATDVLGLGENSSDHVSLVEQWPVPGEKYEALEATTLPGGQVASALLACSRLGLRCAYLGAVGSDAAARVVLEPLGDAGIDLSGVQPVEGAATRSAQILVRASDGERSVLERRDPRLRLDTGRLDRRVIEQSSLLHLDVSDPAASTWAAAVAQAAGIPVVLDADRVVEGTEALLSHVDFPVVSEDFARAWGGNDSANDGLSRLAEGKPRLAVVTRGARGALAWAAGERLESPALDVAVRDTTGAGDAFHAGLIWSLFQESGAVEALHTANAVAGLACTALGAQAGLPDEAALAAFLIRPAQVDRSSP